MPPKPTKQQSWELTDPALNDGLPTDIVIPIMGATGAGKSTLVSQITGKDCAIVGHFLVSCTRHVSAFVIDPIPGYPQLKGCRLVIVDTPGFDDTYVGDVEILKRIAGWLEASYHRQMRIGGVIFLHDISQTRFTGTARRNLEMFSTLCGDDALSKVVFATTKWEKVSPDEGRNREDELKNIHWKPIIKDAQQVRRFSVGKHLGANESDVRESTETCAMDSGEKDPGWDILRIFLDRVAKRHQTLRAKDTALLIQKELAVDKRLIPETKAGMKLRDLLQEVYNQAAEVEKAHGKQQGVEAEERLNELHREMKLVADQIIELDRSLPKRFRHWFGRQ